MGVLGSKMGIGDAMVSPTNSFLLLLVITYVPISITKIEQEMRP